MDDIVDTISPTDEIDEIPETASFISTPSTRSFAMDDFSMTISPTDEVPETDSFIYNPSLASSGTSISSYKTERSINSRKSRYNALPRRKYADISLPNGLASSGVDNSKVSYWTLAYVPLIIVNFQAASGQRPGSTPHIDAGPSQAAVQNAMLIDSAAGAHVSSTIMPHNPFFRTFLCIRYPGP